VRLPTCLRQPDFVQLDRLPRSPAHLRTRWCRRYPNRPVDTHRATLSSATRCGIEQLAMHIASLAHPTYSGLNCLRGPRSELPQKMGPLRQRPSVQRRRLLLKQTPGCPRCQDVLPIRPSGSARRVLSHCLCCGAALRHAQAPLLLHPQGSPLHGPVPPP